MNGWNIANIFEEMSWEQMNHRANGVAKHLLDSGLVEQDKVAQYLYNSPHYMESVLASFKAGMAIVNTNYRYAADELVYLWDNADVRAVVFHGTFIPQIEDVKDRLPNIGTWLWVDDGSLPCPSWATDYESVATTSNVENVEGSWGRSGDHLMLLYTGGTTGMPKGVLWRNADFFVGALGGSNRKEGREYESYEEIAEAANRGTLRWMTSAPFMHGAAQWIALQALSMGHTVVLPDVTDRYDAATVLEVCDREDVEFLQIVGDAFARPLLDASKATGVVPRWRCVEF